MTHASSGARIAVLADVQYADIEDAPNYTRTRTRTYRHARRALARAIQACDGRCIVDL